MDIITKYEPPEFELGDPRILAMPNVPKPCHKLAPRTVMGQKKWDEVRHEVYRRAGYKCEVCGCDVSDLYEKQAHELYRVNYPAGEVKLSRIYCLCQNCHSACHSGRLSTLYRKRSPIYPKAKVLEIAENAFSRVSAWDKEHGTHTPFYMAWLTFLADPTIAPEMEELISKYGITFYDVADTPKKGGAEWGQWHLTMGKQKYYPPYKDEKDWEAAMEENNRKQTEPVLEKPKAEKDLEALLAEMSKVVENSDKKEVDTA